MRTAVRELESMLEHGMHQASSGGPENPPPPPPLLPSNGSLAVNAAVKVALMLKGLLCSEGKGGNQRRHLWRRLNRSAYSAWRQSLTRTLAMP